MRLTLLLLSAAVLLGWARPVHAQSCSSEVAAWIKQCAKDAAIDAQPSHCPSGRVIVHVAGDADLDVEISAARPQSFRRVGELGLSPIGEFADWSKEPEARRKAFDALSTCASKDPLVVSGVPEAKPSGTTRRAPTGTPPLPWLLIAALLFAVVACSSRIRQARVWPFVAIALATFGVRWLVLPRAFFHQNGHGPLWIDHALNHAPDPSIYGPGYAEIFAWAARAAGAEPERGVFLLQAALGALVPPLAWVIARRVGAPRWVALAIALVVFADPLLARLAQSESYFGTQAMLAFAAGAVLAHGSLKPRLRSPAFLASVVCAGLLVSQAARIHPLGWMGLAALPAIVLVGPGSIRSRLVATLVAGFGIALVVGVTSGHILHGVVFGSLGQAWLPRSGPRAQALLEGVRPLILGAVVVAAALQRTRRSVVLAVLAALVLAVMWVSNVLGEPNPAVARAYERAFFPALVGIGAAWVARVARIERRREIVVAAVVAAAGLFASAVSWRLLTTLPTDAREAKLAFEWRRSLPDGARVVYVERAGKQIFVLPLHDGITRAHAFPVRLDGSALPDLSAFGGVTYYYRSSVCSTADAEAACAKLERAVPLQSISRHELPALPSMRWHPYASEVVVVELSRRAQ